MALINSVGVGNGSKSVGEFTYRSVRGRTIASKRVLKNSSNSAAQGNQRSLFAALSKFLTAYDCYVFNAFTKTRYGSRRNRAASEIKALSPYIRSSYETITANGSPLNLVWYWFAQAMSAAFRAVEDDAADAAAINASLLQGSDVGVSIESVVLATNGEANERQGFFVNFVLDKCGAELLEFIRAQKPGWASLSDAEALRRAFSVTAYTINQDGRAYSLGEFVTEDSPSADSITPMGSYVTPNFNLLLNVPISAAEIEHFGLPDTIVANQRVYTFNVLKFLGKPVNMTFAAAFSSMPATDEAIYPIEP